MSKHPISIWGLTDGSAGMVSQVRGVGELLALKTGGIFTNKSARRIKPFCWLPGNWLFAALQQITVDSDSLAPPYPDILLLTGRRSSAMALAIKSSSGGKTKLVHLQAPRISSQYFDLVIPQEHDALHGDNVIETFAALHHLTDEKLANAAADFLKTASITPPFIAMFIGGSTHSYLLKPKHMQAIAGVIKAFATQSALPICISTSRRTGEANTQILHESCNDLIAQKQISVFSGVGNNPYLAWLALADAVVVTNDSVSMMSEALFTGKPLYILKLPNHQKTKPARFAEILIQRGYAKEFIHPLADYAPVKIDEKQRVVEAIIQRLYLTNT